MTLSIILYIFYPFLSNPGQIFENKNCCKNFNFVTVTSIKVYTIASILVEVLSKLAATSSASENWIIFLTWPF